MKIACVSADWTGEGRPGGCAHVRMVLPALAAQRLGHEVAVSWALDVAPSGAFSVPAGSPGAGMADPDVVVLQRIAGPSVPDAIRRARATGQRVLHDVDDLFDALDRRNVAYWATHPDLAGKLARDVRRGRLSPAQAMTIWRTYGAGSGAAAAGSAMDRRAYRLSMAAADAVVASTPYLAERLGRLGVSCAVWRNCVDVAAWEPVRERIPGRIGWTGHLLYRSGDLETVAPILADYMRARPDAHLYHLGATPPLSVAEAFPGVPRDRIVDAEAVPAAGMPEALAASGIAAGIVPLALVPFNEAKSDLKGLEYAAAGLPFVASPTGEYVRLGEQGAGIVTHARPGAWAEALDRALDPVEGARLAAAGLAVAAERDVNAHVGDWLTALSTA